MSLFEENKKEEADERTKREAYLWLKNNFQTLDKALFVWACSAARNVAKTMDYSYNKEDICALYSIKKMYPDG